MAEYSVGRGISDITGEPADAGMMGYGKAEQRTSGIHTRLRSRAFVIDDRNRRVLLIVNDLPLVFESIHKAVLLRLARRFGDVYTDRNTMITATHTHCGPGGYAHHLLYNMTTSGFRRKTFDAIVDGIVEAVQRAHADVAPASLRLAHGQLHSASANRSRIAFERNPQADKDFFPNAIDPQTTLLAIERDGELVGAINWFATHNTSMTNTNTLISSDNKGYAAYRWERLTAGVDYRNDTAPPIITAFAQTNAGDMSPNLELKPGHGPTDDEVENTRIIGTRQHDAAVELVAGEQVPLDGAIDHRLLYVTLSDVEVGPEFTEDGRSHRTGSPAAGASAIAGAWADGVGFPGFREGRNPIFDGLSRHLLYRVSPAMADAHAPKGLVMPGGLLNRVTPIVAERVPLQLIRIGQLYLIGIPGEVTIVAGLRLRRTVAAIVGAPLPDVLVAGYSNGYIHYVTTPQEYDAQQYEGGSTLFGRWELPALQQVAARLATAMRDGVTLDPGDPAPDIALKKRRGPGSSPADTPLAGTLFGDQLSAPPSRARPGSAVRAEFVGAYPNNDLHRGGTFFEVQRESAAGWMCVADDCDFETTFRWRRKGKSGSIITITWNVPQTAERGRYRFVYFGDALTAAGEIQPFTGTSDEFAIE
ncbi:neutral/alkaline non-lysosomal ceramidase N-terminal domain-containing protein [Antrihabitans sp. YC2-6]|uniref:neutral/alkaline non-lysosomal ceramidase N-terminal domain-containing protein n=1 Tax=Antrihabitans sp. YC2-6 TaxID=2799498 RepID=UPI0018F48D82|nr:neutral/alkaline non-lysosomal ceramidase N-terminal domain-containing protein [Antrihabitans sp. YC2-6]MBJ8343551.1 neutral/alkaline ceramidase [Antrihabitans sp. YC2-6]